MDINMDPPLGNLPACSGEELAGFRDAVTALYKLKERAFAAGDPEPIVTRFYAEDAITVGPDGKEIRGRDAFRTMYTRMVRDKTVKITSINAYVRGAAAWDWTNFDIMPNDPAKSPLSFIILFLWAFDGQRWVCGGDMFVSGELAMKRATDGRHSKRRRPLRSRETARNDLDE